MSAKVEKEVEAVVEQLWKRDYYERRRPDYYAENAVFMPPGTRDLKGKEEIVASFAEWREKNPSEPEQKCNKLSQEIWAPCETCAIEVGEWNKTKDDKVVEQGSNLRVFEKIDGEWKIRYHMYTLKPLK